jgi:N-acetylmuramoyl-L-alanine amidase
MYKKLTILFFCLTILFAAFLPLADGIAAGKKITVAVATEDQLRVRTGPGTSFKVIGTLNKGQAVTVLDQNENWLKISASFGNGWIAKQYASLKNENDSKSNSTTTIGTVTGDILNVRVTPATNGTILGKLTKGMTVTVLSKQGNWYEIQFKNQQAWVSSEFVSTNSTDAPGTSTDGIIGTVTASSLSVRESYSLNAKVVASVSKGQSFAILKEVNNWVKIEYKTGKYGWVASWYIDKKSNSAPSEQVKESKVTILQDGTNIRKEPNVQADVVIRANSGDTFTITKIEKDWYQIMLKDGRKGYVAGWIVSVSGSAPKIEKPGAGSYLKNKTIVIDPGHGGVDNGTTGAGGTLEKNLTLRTAKLLYDKLTAAGANVFLTRSDDTYISLSQRVSVAQVSAADAFISLHYDSNLDRSVVGMTGYYYHDYQEGMAETVYSSLVSETGMRNRGVRFGDFHVIRENSQKATLIELGYLSNPSEEMTLTSGPFQEAAASGLYDGLARYFKGN